MENSLICSLFLLELVFSREAAFLNYVEVSKTTFSLSVQTKEPLLQLRYFKQMAIWILE